MGLVRTGWSKYCHSGFALVGLVHQLVRSCPSLVSYCGHVQATTVKPVLAEVDDGHQRVM